MTSIESAVRAPEAIVAGVEVSFGLGLVLQTTLTVGGLPRPATSG